MSKGETIIIIEDDKDDQDVLREVFRDLNIQKELVFFDDCDEAYNYLMSTTQKPFVIISDINLPRLNGIELKKKIDSTDALRRKAIPFIFLTTADNQSTVDRAYEVSNIQGYFRKGVLLEEIRENIRCIVSYWTAALHPHY